MVGGRHLNFINHNCLWATRQGSIGRDSRTTYRHGSGGFWGYVRSKARMIHLTSVSVQCSRSRNISASALLRYDVLVGVRWSSLMCNVMHSNNRIRVCVVSMALSVAVACLGVSLQRVSAQTQESSGTMYSPKRMADGKWWMTQNLNVYTVPSYCYEDAEPNCRRYGRLYTWESARRGCESLGDGWRLPTDSEWRRMSKLYGGVSADSDDRGKAAYKALLVGGSSGFDALLGGGRSEDGQYARLEAHGFYWTASEISSTTGWFYNFGRGGQALHRQDGGEKQAAYSVRCVRD